MYAVLQIPRLALQAVSIMVDSEAKASTEVAEPWVVVDADAKKPVVLELTESAKREGVVVGLSIPQALARCESLVVRYRSGQAEEKLEELLFSMAYTLAPRVELDGPGEVLVDLRGRRFEEVLPACAALVGELAGLGLIVGLGVADSFAVAGLAARRVEGGVLVVGADGEAEPMAGALRRVDNESFLQDLVLEELAMGESLRGVLRKWGIRTVGAFARLKREAVAARLGFEGMQLWDRVTGREERVVAVANPPAEYEESWEFEYDVDSLDPILFMLRRFLDVLSARLRIEHTFASVMRLELGLAYGEPLQVEQKLPEPTSDAEALFRLLMGRTEGLEAESPIVRMVLRLDVVEARERQLGLFESSLRNPYRFTQTLSKVAGIVGSERVGRPSLAANGRPDGFSLEALPASVPPLGKELSLADNYGMPLRRYRPSLKAAVEFQGRQPIWFQCEAVSGFVKAVRGPWLHSGCWWEDAESWNRVEWDVELRKGGVYRISKDENGWSVDGEY